MASAGITASTILRLFFCILILIVMNSSCVKPIYGFQVCVLGGVADADDGIGLDRFGQAQKFSQGGLSAKLRMDFLFAIASIIIFLLMSMNDIGI